MAKEYIVEIPIKQMAYVGDMLRYDDCYEIRLIDNEGNPFWRACLLRFTPERWRSFGFVPTPYVMTIGKRSFESLLDKAIGFTAGVRFAQQFFAGQGMITSGIMQSH